VSVAAQTVLLHLEKLARDLGLVQTTPAEYFARTRERRLRLRSLTADAIEARLAERTVARKNKDFARGDAIRLELERLGITIKDSPTGTEWSIAQ
jgi:cysteinyl-tRNA synthetase